MTDVSRRLIVLALIAGATLLASSGGPRPRHAGGPVLLGAVAVAWLISLWWLAMWILVGGWVSWRRLFLSACATGVFLVVMELAFSLLFSGMVISEDQKYGPIGVIFAVMAFLIAIGIVIILGAVVGLVWQERGPSFTAAFHKQRRAR